MTEDTAIRTVTTRTVGEGDDAITYDVRGDLADASPDRPALFLFGAPMDASGFEILASHFTDRPVVTYDPRGAGRNPQGTADISAERHGDDVHRVIDALGVGAVDAFGSSGGAWLRNYTPNSHAGNHVNAVVSGPHIGAFGTAWVGARFNDDNIVALCTAIGC